MARNKPDLIQGSNTHRRTEGDYMGALLDTVTIDDWRDVVRATLQLAKDGDPQARAWLAQYLMGKATAPAPTALSVQVNQWGGNDPLAERLASPLIAREEFPRLHGNDAWKGQIQDAMAQEIARKLPPPETPENPELARNAGDSGKATVTKLPN